MAWIEKKGRGRYLVRWRESDGSEHSKGGLSYDEARTMKATVEKAQREGSYTSKEMRSQPLLRYLETIYEADLTLRAVTRSNYEAVIRLHLDPRLPDVTVEGFTPQVARRLFSELHADAGPWVTQMAYRMIRRAVRQAQAEGLLHLDPLASVKAPRPQRREVRILTPGEVQAVANAIEPRFRAMVLLSAWGGFRVGELGALRREDVDLTRDTITVRRSLSTPGGKREIGPPKSDASRRTVAMPSWVMGELVEHLLGYSHPDGWIFCHTDGDLVTHASIRYWWEKARTAVAPPPRFHDLRHTAVALLIEQGAHPKKIQSRMGHSSITMTMDVYGHLFPDADAELAAALESFRPEVVRIA